MDELPILTPPSETACELVTPGVYDRLDFDTYRAINAVNQSSLKVILSQSPKHYVASRERQTSALAFGSAFHAAILTPEDFEASYYVAVLDPKKPKMNTKAGKARMVELNNEADGRHIIYADEMDMIQTVKRNIQGHEKAASLVDTPFRELTLVWVDPKTRILCKARLDLFVQAEGGVIILPDLKTCRDARREPFYQSIRTYGYDFQAAFYRRAVASHFKTDPALIHFAFIAVEKTAPFDLNVWVPDEQMMNLADADVERALEILRDCIERDEWPGYSQSLDAVMIGHPNGYVGRDWKKFTFEREQAPATIDTYEPSETDNG